MRRQIIPDRPLPADRGLLGKARQQGLHPRGSMPSFHTLPTRPGIDYHAVLEDLGCFEVVRPLNIRSETATAIAMVLVLLATPACESKDEKEAKQQALLRAEKYEQCLSNLNIANGELSDLSGKRVDRSFTKTGDTYVDLPECAAAMWGVREEIDRVKAIINSPEYKAAQGRHKKRQEISEYSKGYEHTVEFYVDNNELFEKIQSVGDKRLLKIFQMALDGDSSLLEGNAAETLGSGRYWSFMGAFDGELKEITSQDHTSDADTILDTGLVGNAMNVFLSLPYTQQAIFLQRLEATAQQFKDALSKYRKYRVTLDHHLEWETGKFKPPYKDPCGRTSLHEEYRKDEKVQMNSAYIRMIGDLVKAKGPSVIYKLSGELTQVVASFKRAFKSKKK